MSSIFSNAVPKEAKEFMMDVFLTEDMMMPYTINQKDYFVMQHAGIKFFGTSKNSVKHQVKFYKRTLKSKKNKKMTTPQTNTTGNGYSGGTYNGYANGYNNYNSYQPAKPVWEDEPNSDLMIKLVMKEFHKAVPKSMKNQFDTAEDVQDTVCKYIEDSVGIEASLVRKVILYEGGYIQGVKAEGVNDEPFRDAANFVAPANVM